MAQIMMTASQLAKKKSELESLNRKFVAEVSDLEQNMNQLKAMWEGDAANAYQAQFRKDDAKLHQYSEGIRQYIRALETLIKKYEQAEKKNIQIAKH